MLIANRSGKLIFLLHLIKYLGLFCFTDAISSQIVPGDYNDVIFS